MNKSIKTLKACGKLLGNKSAAILILPLIMNHYADLSKDEPTPFAELIYAAILVVSVIVAAPVIRLLVFPAAAEMAESGTVRKFISLEKPNSALYHYWFATFISYLVSLLCVSSLL